MRSWLKWAGHVERMEGVRLMKRVDALRVECRRGRPRLRWEDCVKRDLVGIGGEGRMRARGGGRGDSSETGSVRDEGKQVEDQYQCQPHPGWWRQRGETTTPIHTPPRRIQHLPKSSSS